MPVCYLCLWRTHRTVQFTLSLGERMSHGKHLQCRRNKNINLTLHTYTTGSESSSSHTSSTWRTLARVRDAKIQLKGTWCCVTCCYDECVWYTENFASSQNGTNQKKMTRIYISVCRVLSTDETESRHHTHTHTHITYHPPTLTFVKNSKIRNPLSLSLSISLSSISIQHTHI